MRIMATELNINMNLSEAESLDIEMSELFKKAGMSDQSEVKNVFPTVFLMFDGIYKLMNT